MNLANKLPTVSVLLAVYNSERYLRAALESILAQTFDDFEILILDDGSTDGSLKIIREYQADARLLALSRENRGHVASLNELIGLARGRLLARMDSDDICRPQRFEKQVAYLDAHPNCVAVGSGFLLIDPDGLPICEFRFPCSHQEIDSAHLSALGELKMCNPSVMMRRDAVMKVGLYRNEYRFAEDLDLMLRLGEIGALGNLPEILFEYRHHLKSMSYVHSDRQHRDAMQAVTAARARRGLDILGGTSEVIIKAETNGDVHRKWAWWALSAGNIHTARKHAINAFVAQPLNIENLRAVGCAIRGY